MTELQTMVRTELSVQGSTFFLAQGQDVEDLKSRIEAAAATSGTFVTFIEVGNRSVSVLISAGSPVVFSTETVQFDPRDTGEDDAPYGGLFDY